jgi:hypothetical protein
LEVVVEARKGSEPKESDHHETAALLARHSVAF